MSEPTDNLRLSDLERTHALESLGTHYAEGRLDDAEFDQRISQVSQAKTFGEIRPAFEDLPGGVPFSLPTSATQSGQLVPQATQLDSSQQNSEELELEALKRRGHIVNTADAIGGGVAFAAFFIGMMLGVPYFWAAFILWGIASGGIRAYMNYSDADEEIYDKLKEQEEEDRAKRLEKAQNRLKEIEG